jgi:hypothetical protein
MPTPETCTLAEFARRRGVSRKTTTTWKQRGWLTMRGNLVDVAASTKNLATRPEVYRGGRTNRDSTNGAAEMEAARERFRHDDGTLSIQEAQRLKENYLMKLRALEYEKERHALVPADQVEKVWAQAIANARKHLLAIPSKLAERALLCKTPAAMEQLLRDEIYAALTELSRTTFEADDDDDGDGKGNGGAA